MPSWSASKRPSALARLLRVAACLLIAGLAAPGLASATDYQWLGANGGNWNDPANWSSSTGLPGYPNGVNDTGSVLSATPLVIVIPSVASTITLKHLEILGVGGTVGILGLNSTLVLLPQNGQPVLDISKDTELGVHVRLGDDSIVRVSPGTLLKFDLSISEQGGSRAFIKRGAGVVQFAGSNTYTGTTTIEDGSLRLLTAHALVRAAKVDVRADASFFLSESLAMGDLSITEGLVEIAVEKELVVQHVTMSGGTIHANSVSSATLSVRGHLTASSSVNGQPALIDQGVRVNASYSTQTFTVNDGPAAHDVEIQGFVDVAVFGTGLIKDGPGTMFLGPALTAAIVYGSLSDRGPTWVKEGRLELQAPITVDLRIGDGVGHAEVVQLGKNLIDDPRAVTVEADGVYTLQAEETIDQLTVNGGSVFLGATGSVALRLRSLVMNGGLIDTAGATLTVNDVPNARIQATSTVAQTATIRGFGLLILNPAVELIVNDGPRPIDLSVDVGISSPFGRGLRKSGAGVARVTRDGANYNGPTLVDAGTLLINANYPLADITVGAATLGGVGTTGRVTAAGSTIAPGQSPGVLHTTGHVQLASSVTFATEIASPTSVDQWAVTGTVSLVGAALAITVATAPGVTLPVNATFPIITNDGIDAISGTFAHLAEGASVVVDRYTFGVSYHGGDGNDVVLTVTNVAPDVLSYFLAEGATGSFFDEDVLIANPNDTDAPVTLTFLQEGGGTIVDHRIVPKQARLTVHVDQIAGLENASPSVQIVSDQKLPLIAERSMFWDPSSYGGHTANAVARPEQTWIFAEGFQGFFDTYLLIANANATETTATVTFLRENDTPVVRTFPIGAFARKTIYAGDISELLGRAFGMVVDATRPVIAERSMYFGTIPGRLWAGGHGNTGVTAPSTSWFHAEGATGRFFKTFILLSNPQTTEAHIDLRFLLEDGTAIVKSKTLPAGQRLTVNPAAEGDARLENAALSTVVVSDVPVVSERSMYWPGDAVPFGEGHNSSGVVATATRWGLAEGRVGTPRHFTTYILLANPTTTAAQVTVTYLRESGAPVTKTYTVQPTSRFNIDVGSAVPELKDESFGARIDVTNGVAIAVERSLYWDANGIFWAGGTNALGTPLP